MISTVTEVSAVDRQEWYQLARFSSTSTFFQAWECYNFYASLMSLKPFFFAVREDDTLKGVIVGYIQQEGHGLKKYLTRRAIIIGGPLLADDISESALVALLSECTASLKGRTIYIETRNYNDYSSRRDVFETCGFAYQEHLNFHIDTSSEEIMLQNLGKSRKRDIKASLKSGAEIVDTPVLSDIRDFYGILQNLYETRVKTPLFPFEFFEKLFSSGLGIFRLVRYAGEIIGGTLCVVSEGRCVYEWFACGRDGDVRNIFPSTLATYSGIEYAVRSGIPRFDMMGAGKPDEGYGVREFKSKFGGELVEHGRFLFVCKPLLYQIGKLGVKMLKKLK